MLDIHRVRTRIEEIRERVGGRGFKLRVDLGYQAIIIELG